jgi:hypothetical protein
MTELDDAFERQKNGKLKESRDNFKPDVFPVVDKEFEAGEEISPAIGAPQLADIERIQKAARKKYLSNNELYFFSFNKW